MSIVIDKIVMASKTAAAVGAMKAVGGAMKSIGAIKIKPLTGMNLKTMPKPMVGVPLKTQVPQAPLNTKLPKISIGGNLGKSATTPIQKSQGAIKGMGSITSKPINTQGLKQPMEKPKLAPMYHGIK